MSEQTWRTIESAPKDGTNILGFADGGMTVVRFIAYEEVPEFSHWTLACPGSYAEDSDWTPTHWMPLPAPPEP